MLKRITDEWKINLSFSGTDACFAVRNTSRVELYPANAERNFKIDSYSYWFSIGFTDYNLE